MREHPAAKKARANHSIFFFIHNIHASLETLSGSFSFVWGFSGYKPARIGNRAGPTK